MENEEKQITGIVWRKTMSRYTVRVADSTYYECSISNRLHKQLMYPTGDGAATNIHKRVQGVKEVTGIDPIALGDEVSFAPIGDDQGNIRSVLPRRNKLSRKAAGKRIMEQVLFANLDLVIPVFSASKPKPKWNLLDRFLASAEHAKIDASICITKMDTIDFSDISEEVELYESLGYEVFLTSAVDGSGVDRIKEKLRDVKSIFMGVSGVGKTSLLNVIQPDLGMKVKEISKKTGKGQHTTTHYEMFELDQGGAIVDTPGIREFGLWEIEGQSMDRLFREFRSYHGKCRFGRNCTHDHEPDCAIIEAVDKGEISKRRYVSYLKMLLTG